MLCMPNVTQVLLVYGVDHCCAHKSGASGLCMGGYFFSVYDSMHDSYGHIGGIVCESRLISFVGQFSSVIAALLFFGVSKISNKNST